MNADYKLTSILLLASTIALGALLSACSLFANKEPEPSVFAPTVAKQTQVPMLELFDSSLFDNKLYSMLEEKPDTLVVKTAGDVSINQMPQRLDKWLSYIDKKGGNVEVKPDPETKNRFISNLIISLAIGIYDKIYDSVLYSPSKHYNVTVYYKPNGQLTRVVFNKRD